MTNFLTIKTAIVPICLFFSSSCLTDSKTNDKKEPEASFLIIEKVRVRNGKEYREYFKKYDANNNVLLYVEGNSNTTDSVVYNYDFPKGTVEVKEFKPEGKGVLILENSHIDSIKKGANTFFVDSFDLYDRNSFIEIDRAYNNKLKVYELKTDTGVVNKYKYDVGEEAFIVLPYTSNNRGADTAEKLDSLNLYCYNKKVISEEYFFEGNKRVIRKYYYNGYRLTRVRTDLFLNNKTEEGFDELYTYKYIK
jgi:hypothetical protein